MVENALTLKEMLNERMIGGLHTLPDECDMLYRYASLEGDHVEIGCMWGGTAILAALAKIENGVKGHVYTIDKMKQGFWDVGDPIYGRRVPTLEKVKKNFDTFGVSERVTVIRAESDPLPLPEDVRPRVSFIDGGHNYVDCYNDWMNLREITTGFILFHDYFTGKHPGVQMVVDDIIKDDSDWKKVEQVDYLIAFERVR